MLSRFLTISSALLGSSPSVLEWAWKHLGFALAEKHFSFSFVCSPNSCCWTELIFFFLFFYWSSPRYLNNASPWKVKQLNCFSYDSVLSFSMWVNRSFISKNDLKSVMLELAGRNFLHNLCNNLSQTSRTLRWFKCKRLLPNTESWIFRWYKFIICRQSAAEDSSPPWRDRSRRSEPLRSGCPRPSCEEIASWSSPLLCVSVTQQTIVSGICIRGHEIQPIGFYFVARWDNSRGWGLSSVPSCRNVTFRPHLQRKCSFTGNAPQAGRVRSESSDYLLFIALEIWHCATSKSWDFQRSSWTYIVVESIIGTNTWPL